MEEVDFESLADVISSGAAVCLLGAGFSQMAMRGDGVDSVPDTALLTSEIKTLMGVPNEDYLSLSDAAELCQDDPHQKSKLNSLLIQRLTSTIPTEDQKWLVNLNWRAIFTTNFDDVIEQSRSNPDFVPITPKADLSTVPPAKLPIYYLHGRALDLREQDKDPSFVISETNYLELGSKSKQLYARLFNEIICARAVILIGYSLRDLEIAKGFLNKSGALRDKTFIVTRSLDQGHASKRLEKFGAVLPIGLDGFRANIAHHLSVSGARHNFNYLREFSFTSDLDTGEADITGDDFLKSVIVGRIDPVKYASQARSPETPYCVQRTRALEQIVRAPQQRFIVSSDFGNGKTAFLDQLAVELFTAGKKVYFVETKIPDVFDEIDQVMCSNSDVAFLIDDVVRYRNVAQYIGSRLNGRSILVCTTRGNEDAQYEQISAEIGGAHRFIDLNVLDDLEINAWDSLLERWGYWELRSALSADQRKSSFLMIVAERIGRLLYLSLAIRGSHRELMKWSDSF